tara:strand:- start:4600 stop:4926 length:327 start_codon:yes stop_codon:yes gene_type:complete
MEKTNYYKLLEDVKHLGGKRKGEILTCVGAPKGPLAALVHFKQVKQIKSKPAKSVDPDPNAEPELKALTVEELKGLAADKGVEIAPGAAKPDIIAAIELASEEPESSD